MKFKNAVMFASVITGLNVLVQTGFSMAGLFSPASILPAGVVANDAAFTFALYAVARTLPLALFVAFVIWKKYIRMLIVLGILSAAIQFADMWIGIYQLDVGKSVGPFVLGCLQSYAIWMLHKAHRQLLQPIGK